MLCEKCGKALIGNETVCRNCGEPVSKVSSEQIVSFGHHEQKMFCKKCGATLKENATFCQSCGEYVSKNQPSVSPVPISPGVPTIIPTMNPQKVYSSSWSKLVRTCAWIMFIAIVLLGFIISIPMFESAGRYYGNSLGIYKGLLIIGISVLLGLLIVSGVMISLDKADDLRTLRKSLTDIQIQSCINIFRDEQKNELQQIQKEMKQICGKLEDLADKQSKK